MSRLTDARDAVGGLANPSKVPCRSTSTPAENCHTGSKLMKVKGSVCEDCYACKGNYVFPNVKKALKRRLDALSHPDWVENMAIAINKAPYFRWHDSGDIQGVWHLSNIVEVAKRTPETKHWLPTREAKYVSQYSGDIPDNLIVRVSAAMVDGSPPKRFHLTSTVHRNRIPTDSFVCPAPKQDNKCGECRACWDKAVPNVSYTHH